MDKIETAIKIGNLRDDGRRWPLHQEIASELRRQIDAGEFAPGQPVPSEHALMRRFGVSRGTVRQARAALRAEGLISGGRGKAFIVRGKPLSQSFSALISFSAWVESLGKQASGWVVEATWRAPDAETRRQLELPPGASVYDLVRVRLADGEPLMVERTAFASSLGRLVEEFDVERGSIYAELARRGVAVRFARHQIGAVAASRADSRLLGVSPGSPLLWVRRLGFGSGGEPLEWSDDRYRADRVAFTIENSAAVDGVARRLEQDEAIVLDQEESDAIRVDR